MSVFVALVVLIALALLVWELFRAMWLDQEIQVFMDDMPHGTIEGLVDFIEKNDYHKKRYEKLRKAYENLPWMTGWHGWALSAFRELVEKIG